MTTEDKLEKINKLADDMYYAAANLGSNVGSGERLRKTMEEYHKFIIHECKEEPVSEDLGEYINELSKQFPEVSFAKLSRIAVRVSNWQKENLWKPADGDDLPEYDREVIVMVKYSTQLNIHDKEYQTYRVEFGHRPNPDGWDGKSLTTGEVEHYIPKTYDKGGWNVPDIVYWLDVELPKEIEEL